jgi:hypothetical protein
MAWADRDKDGLPDFPVGRIPARKTDELDIVVRKIIAWEKQPASREDLRIGFWAGSPMYGALIDSMATALGLTVLSKHSPLWVEPSVLTADRRYALCAWPPDQPAHFAGWMARGGLVNVLMGHGSERSMYSMTHAGRRVEFSYRVAEQYLKKDRVASPLLVFTCSSGNFASRSPCLTEQMLLARGGPVATVGATAESHPLPNYNSGVASLNLLHDRPRRIGPYWLRIARRTARSRNLIMEMLLAQVEATQGMKTDPARLNRDQALLYALLGDPATRLRSPVLLEVDVTPCEKGWEWKAERPDKAGELSVQFRPLSSGHAAGPEDLDDRDACNKAFEKANADLGFRTLKKIAPDRPWQGLIEKPGRLRLVCACGDRIAVFCAQLTDRGTNRP